MRPNLINTDSLSDNILNAVSKNTGITNFSGSSKLRTIVESFSEELKIFSDSVDSVTNNIFTETASGAFLDANGSEFGVFRKSTPTLSIKASDGVGYLRPINEDVGFSKMLVGKLIIQSGTSISVGNKYNITFTEDVRLEDGQKEIPVSIKLSLINKDSSISISQNSEFRLDSTLSPLLANVKLVFNRAIEISSLKEKDSELRERIILSKSTIKSASTNAIALALLGAPYIYGFRIEPIGAAIVDIYIATKELLDYGFEPNSQTYINVTKNLLNEVGAAGIMYNVILPKQLNFLAKVKYDKDLVDEATVKNAIVSIMKEYYKYNNNSTIIVETLNTIIKNKVGRENTIIIDSVQVYDPDLDIIISNSEYSISVPLYGFLFFNKEGIEIEPI